MKAHRNDNNTSLNQHAMKSQMVQNLKTAQYIKTTTTVFA